MSKYIEAVKEWQMLLGERAITDKRLLERYGSHTLHPEATDIMAACILLTVEEVISVVRTAAHHHINVYPISIGHNWGYGSASPAQGGCVVLDLSKMNKILSFDRALGLVTVEPGVTHRQLHAFLKKEQAPFLAPIFGSGSQCSLIGNALDRGHSLTPYTDRFASLHALGAVLSDGSMYQSAHSEENAQAFYKWGIGPYLDGLFVQSNLGIVVEATFLLAPRPQRIEGFVLNLAEDADLGGAIDYLRNLQQRLGSLLPSIKIYNPQRVLYMTTALSKPEALEQGLLPQKSIEKGLQELSYTHWTIVGAFYGEKRLVRTGKSIFRREMARYTRRLTYVNESIIDGAQKLPAFLSLSRAARALRAAYPFLKNISWSFNGGEGNSHSRDLLLWSRGRPTREPVQYDEEPDCGFIFFSGAFPFKGACAGAFAKRAEAICRSHLIEPILALYTMSETTMIVTAYILFDRSNAQHVQKAMRCYEELVRMTKEYEGYVHRLPITHMHELDAQNPFWAVAKKVKDALDPEGIIAPGRYIR